jgi:putative transposase
VREDCLDHLLVLSRRHLEVVLADYIRHYNGARPHRGLGLERPLPRPVPSSTDGRVIRRDIFGGLIHEYERAALTWIHRRTSWGAVGVRRHLGNFRSRLG